MNLVTFVKYITGKLALYSTFMFIQLLNCRVESFSKEVLQPTGGGIASLNEKSPPFNGDIGPQVSAEQEVRLHNLTMICQYLFHCCQGR